MFGSLQGYVTQSATLKLQSSIASVFPVGSPQSPTEALIHSPCLDLTEGILCKREGGRETIIFFSAVPCSWPMATMHNQWLCDRFSWGRMWQTKQWYYWCRKYCTVEKWSKYHKCLLLCAKTGTWTSDGRFAKNENDSIWFSATNDSILFDSIQLFDKFAFFC